MSINSTKLGAYAVAFGLGMVGGKIAQRIHLSRQIAQALIERYDTQAVREVIPDTNIGIDQNPAGEITLYLVNEPSKFPSLDSMLETLARKDSINVTHPNIQK